MAMQWQLIGCHCMAILFGNRTRKANVLATNLKQASKNCAEVSKQMPLARGARVWRLLSFSLACSGYSEYFLNADSSAKF
jgi:hypothetical protein